MNNDIRKTLNNFGSFVRANPKLGDIVVTYRHLKHTLTQSPAIKTC